MKIYLFFGLLMMKLVRNWFVTLVGGGVGSAEEE